MLSKIIHIFFYYFTTLLIFSLKVNFYTLINPLLLLLYRLIFCPVFKKSSNLLSKNEQILEQWNVLANIKA